MCGRFTLTVPSYEELAEALGVGSVEGAAPAYKPRFNVAPTDPAWIVRMYHGQKELVSSHWGFIPRWAKTKNQGGRPINARSEALGLRTSLFRDSIVRRRCVVVADGFVEWQTVGRDKRPYWFKPSSGDLLLMAGVWDHFFDEETQQKIGSFSILTTKANADVEPLHDRMPVILARADIPLWIAPSDVEDGSFAIPPEVRALFAPSKPGTLTRTRISNRMNSVKNDDPSCISPPSEEELAAAEVAANAPAKPKPKPKRAKKAPAPEAALSLFADADPARKTH